MIDDPVETEIKLAATAAMLDSLRSHPALAGQDKDHWLHATYFDTPEFALRQVGASLRIRDDGKTRELTFKLPSGSGGGLRRSEWNCIIVGDQPDLEDFPVRVRDALTRLVSGQPLLPVAATKIDRISRKVACGASIAAIAFDCGMVEAEDRSEPVHELELELAEGRLADVIALALALPVGPELQWSIRSKAQRCHDLAVSQTAPVVQSRPPELDGALSAAAGFQIIAWNCLEHLLANYRLVIGSGAPEAVHQSRVALRRLRAALKLFGKLTRDDERAVLLAELKAAADGLGPARDLFVLAEQVAGAATAAGIDAADLLAHLRAMQDKATQAARAMLADAPFQRLLLQVAAWIEGGEWRARASLPDNEARLSAAAANALSRLHRKLRDHGRKLDRMSDEVRHRVRIDVKKLRYAHALLASQWREPEPPAEQARLARDLAKLQNCLGRLNDMAVATRSRGDLFTDLAPITAAGLQARLDEVLDSQQPAHRRQLKSAQTLLERVRDTREWWQEK